jgi:tetratricopeptide (TPR) repeat protein
MQAEAITQFQTAMNLSKRSNPVMEAYVGVGYSLMGKRDETRQILDSLLERSKEMYFAPSVVARLLFALGETDQAFEWLDRALEAHDYYLRFLKLEALFGFYDIASDPRFEAVLKKIGLE